MALRRANATVAESRGLFGGIRSVTIVAGRTRLDVPPRAWQAAVAAGSPVMLAEVEARALWWTPDGLFWEDEGLDAAAVDLLLWDRRRRQDARLDRLRKIRAAEEAVEGSRRQRIPDDVRAFVWQRDEGRCVRCGSEDDLQFDHVIPVAKGGGNAAENVQVLCGACNRAKSDSIV